MNHVKYVGLLMRSPSTQTDMPFVLPAKLISTLMINLDYYDQLCLNEQYSEDTLFAFGSEEYLQTPANDSKYTKTEIPLGFTTFHVTESY